MRSIKANSFVRVNKQMIDSQECRKKDELNVRKNKRFISIAREGRIGMEGSGVSRLQPLPVPTQNFVRVDHTRMEVGNINQVNDSGFQVERFLKRKKKTLHGHFDC